MRIVGWAALLVLSAQADHGYVEEELRLDEGSCYAYRLLAPVEMVEGRRYPLLVFLHGAGERGNDNLAQLVHLPDRLATPEYRTLFDGYVLAPQCRSDQRWVETDWSAETSTPMAAEPSPMLAAAMRALDAVVAAHAIDEDRIYLTGLSMGGYGSWELATRQPRRFAAVVPVCGGGDERRAADLAPLPIWAWHGGADGVVPVRRTRDMIDALREAGGDARYTELAGVGHAAWTAAYAPDSPVWPWLAAQRRGRPDPTLAEPTAADALVLDRSSSAVLELDGAQRLVSLTFAADLDGPRRVSGRGITLPDGGEVRYLRGPAVAIQTVDAPLVLEGDAVLRNDNDWTHMADLLRFGQPLSGSGTVTIRGDGLGGVELPREREPAFRGRFVVESGRLVLSQTRVSTGWHPIELCGGDVFLAAGSETREELLVRGDAGLLAGLPSRLLGRLTIEEGARFVLDSGGGNPVELHGPLDGAGTLVVRGASADRPGRPVVLASAEAGSFAGALHVERGSVELARPLGDGVREVVLGGPGLGCLVVAADARLPAGSLLRVHDGWIEQRVPQATYGVLDLRGDLELDLGGERSGGRSAAFAFSGEHVPARGAQLVVRGFRSEIDRVVLTAAGTLDWARVLPHVGFRGPQGRLHGARRAEDGALAPGDEVEPRGAFAHVDPGRARLYESDGLRRLAGPGSPVTGDAVLSFFGDSITWADVWPQRIERALRAGPETGQLAFRIHNRGINGGGVLQVLNGSPTGARRGGNANAPQAPYAEVLASDGTTLAVVFIGINDLWWRETGEAEYERGLEEIVHLSSEAGVRLVLATPWLFQEFPGGSGPKDVLVERFAGVVRRVAEAGGVTLVDLRAAAVAWLMDHNTELRLDGSYEHRATGLLTTDGVHASPTGAEMLANLIADRVHRALER